MQRLICAPREIVLILGHNCRCGLAGQVDHQTKGPVLLTWK